MCILGVDINEIFKRIVNLFCFIIKKRSKMMVNVKVYSTTTCPWCTKVKEFLKENKIKFKDINISEDEKARNEIIEKSGQMGVPIIEIGNKIIVGFDESKIRKALKL